MFEAGSWRLKHALTCSLFACGLQDVPYERVRAQHSTLPTDKFDATTTHQTTYLNPGPQQVCDFLICVCGGGGSMCVHGGGGGGHSRCVQVCGEQ